MNQYTILWNPHANNGRGQESVAALRRLLDGDELAFYDMTEIPDYAAFFAALPPARKVVVSGGDGTLNRFLNDTAALEIPNELFYFAAGSGNDFLHDVGEEKGAGLVPLGPYIRNLPQVTVNEKTYRVLNGVGYGIDGYCCAEGDLRRSRSTRPVNYTAIAVKGLLFRYKPTGATVTVDGRVHRYRKVWLAPTMNGRFYGGGMMPTPRQNRLGDGTLSTMVFHDSRKLKTLLVFPTIFKGEHVRHTKMVDVFTGRDISVTFDRPTALQIDGETIPDVTGYRITAPAAERAPGCQKGLFDSL